MRRFVLPLPPVAGQRSAGMPGRDAPPLRRAITPGDDIGTDQTGPARECLANGIPNALLVVAFGVLLVSLGYARARAGSGFAVPLFWTGQVLILVFAAYRLLRPSTPAPERVFLILLYAAQQSGIRWAYSPRMFTFSDELQHWRTLDSILTNHHLFGVNYSLPISPRYPGLE